jgi:hypothetical protein
MNGKKIWLSSLAVALLGLGVVRGQGSGMGGGQTAMPAPSYGVPAPSSLPAPPGDAGMPPPPGQQFTLSNWIIGERCANCCGPIGADGPIRGEIYMRNGVSFPINGGALSQGIDTGWDIEGGARSLFFNRDVDAAWTVDIGITNVFNPASKNAGQVTLQNVPLKTIDQTGTATTINVPALNVTPGNLNRTSVNLAGGREIWLLGTADSSHYDLNWRVGWDVGGRWGTQKLELNELEHRNSQFGGVFVALHSDIEVPCGNCILQTGIRTEWSCDFSQILQNDNNGNVMDLNLMFTLGIRF